MIEVEVSVLLMPDVFSREFMKLGEFVGYRQVIGSTPQ